MIFPMASIYWRRASSSHVPVYSRKRGAANTQVEGGAFYVSQVSVPMYEACLLHQGNEKRVGERGPVPHRRRGLPKLGEVGNRPTPGHPVTNLNCLSTRTGSMEYTAEGLRQPAAPVVDDTFTLPYHPSK